MTVNVYGEEIDPELHEQLTSEYLNNEIERGAIITLIRHLGAMTAESLAERTGLPQDRVLQHLLRMKRSELLVITGETHGYLLYDIPRTPSESEITFETVSALALQLAQAKTDLATILKDLKAQDIGTLSGALEIFSRARDRLEKVTISGSIINKEGLVAIEEKIRSAVIMTTRTRARLPSTRPKVTIEDLVDVDVPTVLEEYESQMGYTPLLGFGTINWDDSKCLGCKSCEIICPEDAIKLKPIIDTPRIFELDEATLEQTPVNRLLFYQTVRNLAVEKASQNIHLEREAPGFGTVETDLYLCIGCRSCVRRCPGPAEGALDLELKWTLPEVIRQITTQTQ
jgi:ferredoxin